jgi:hypothetical protein
MRTIIPAVIATVTPILMLVLIVGGVALHIVEWQPPMVLSTQSGTNAQVTAISSNANGFYAGGYDNITYSPTYTGTIFIARYDLNGRQIWTERIGSVRDERIDGMVAGSDGVYLLLYLNNTILVSKYGQDESEVWSNTWGKFDYSAPSISLAPTGVLVGSLTSDPNGTQNIVVSSYDSEGNTLWTKPLGNEGNQSGYVNIYGASNGLYVAGSGEIAGYSDTHAFLSKYDVNGTLEWTRLFDDKLSGFICQCELTGLLGSSSGLYVLGYSQNGFPLQSLVPGSFIRKYDLNGNVLWTIIMNAPDGGAIFSYAVSVSTSGIYFTESTVPGGNNFIIKYDTNGNNVLTFSITDSSDAISATNTGIVVGGTSVAQGDPAFIEEFREPSSLVFFGINPPFSFAAVGGLVAVAALSILYYSRRGRKRPVSKAASRPKPPTGSDENPLPRWKPA